MDKQLATFFTSWSVPSIQYCNLRVRHNLILSNTWHQQELLQTWISFHSDVQGCFSVHKLYTRCRGLSANRVHGGLSCMVFNKKQSEFYRYSLSLTLVIFSMVLSSSSTNHLKFLSYIYTYIHLLIFYIYTHTHICGISTFTAGETYLQLVGKIKLYQVTVYQNKIGICAFCLYRSNFCHLKKIYIFICIKTCHMMKKVRKQLGLRISEHQLSSYAPL